MNGAWAVSVAPAAAAVWAERKCEVARVTLYKLPVQSLSSFLLLH